MFGPEEFFDLSDQFIAEMLSDCDFVWNVLDKLDEQIKRLVGSEPVIKGDVMPGAYISDRLIFLAEGARVEPGAYLLGPAYVGPNAVIRHGAYVRENVIMMEGSALGHASEAKNALFLSNAHAPHFNYVGDSIVGRRVNLGAGTKLSNLTLVSQKDAHTKKRPTIKIQVEGVEYDTGLAKLGAILGDDTQTGCNSVLNPGCLIGRGSLVYANLSLR